VIALITAFRVLLPLVTLYAFLRGGRDEQYVGVICVAGMVLTHLAISPLAGRFESVELPVFAVDLAVLAGFLMVAFRSTRFWPLWVAGLQLTTVLGHFLKGIDNHLLPRAYGVALGFWAYPILLILAVGVWRNERRARAERRQAPTG
jgi:nicotinamide riboside transporter PnuC